MELFAIVFAGFIAAPLAPWLCRGFKGSSGWVLALVPLAIFVMLAMLTPRALEGGIAAKHEWAPALGVDLSLRLDGLTLLLGLLVSGIGTLVFVYAGSYLKGHAHLGRLFAYLLMFMASMMGVLLADNLLILFVFWELTSVSSYLLIGFDHTQEKSRKAALQALLTTGLGGLALLAGGLLLGHAAGTLEIAELAARRDQIAASGLYVPIVLLFALAAFTKSAQFPFHFWLPNAMAAPTPVSAYLHSSTMVKAGVYLLARFSPVLSGSELWAGLLTWAGAVTMLVGAWLAYRQSVMKPLLAYTTMSALGIIVMAIGIGSEEAVIAGMVFLLAHALYKGALFMAAGTIDHETGEKDLSKLGGLGGAMPVLFGATLIAAASMAGLPPLVGFVGKELYLEAMLPESGATAWAWALLGMFVACAVLTVAVSVRMGLRPFIGERVATPVSPHEAPAGMLLGPVTLALMGMVAAVAPGLFASGLAGGAAAAVLGRPVDLHIALWHGVNAPLLISAGAVAVGLLAYWMQRPILSAVGPLVKQLDAVGPARGYQATLDGVLAFARLQTNALQSGYLRRYVYITLSTAIAAIGGTLLFRGGLERVSIGESVRYYEVGLVVLMLGSAVYAAMARSRMAAIAAMGIVGYGVALVFVLFGAPDLAFTQVCIETLTVILMLLVFSMLPDFRTISSNAQRGRDVVIAVAGGTVMAGLVLVSGGRDADTAVSEFYSAASVPEAFGRNVVNVILVDFRALDTLGEITVLVVAAVGVVALMRLKPMREIGSDPAGEHWAVDDDDSTTKVDAL